ncbi:MAG: DUF1015 domain-containing protein [Armatimonadota bacterium]
MAIICPFRGVLYNQDKIGKLDDVVAPPYDVISPEDQQWYYDRHPNNVVRLILPKEDQPCGSASNKYESSANCLNEWLGNGVLAQDPSPALYVCRQEYVIDGEVKQRVGFTCLVRLEDYDKGTVLPHENILARPMDDRLNVLRYARSNYDSVFGLYAGGTADEVLKSEMNREPDASATDKDGVVCDLWRISNSSSIDSIVESLAQQSILIADGHHRYAAALAYRNEMREKASAPDPDAPYEFVMMTLVSLEDKGLVVLPTHRMVRNIENLDTDKLLSGLSEYFEITESTADKLFDTVESMFSEDHVFGLYIGSKAYVIKLKPEAKPEEIIQGAGSVALKRLDVTILHSLILEKYFGIGVQQMSAQSNLSYTRNPKEAIRLVDTGDYQLSFLMNPTRVSEVRAIAASGEKMPQKSTFFYPKLLTGVIIRVM